jgi:hypothetical protein
MLDFSRVQKLTRPVRVYTQLRIILHNVLSQIKTIVVYQTITLMTSHSKSILIIPAKEGCQRVLWKRKASQSGKFQTTRKANLSNLLHIDIFQKIFIFCYDANTRQEKI